MADRYLEYLKNYSGRELTLMEICGSHTAAIAKSGIKSVISPLIRLISGPGCPVCVCPTEYIDRLVKLALEGNVIACFGDMLRVPGSGTSLSEARGEGADVRMLYSPLDLVDIALKEWDRNFVFAAVGFETTIPVYTLLLDELEERNIKNIKLLTALKCMGPVIEYLCGSDTGIDGFIAPGHVAVITGTKLFGELSEKYDIPFSVTGFSDNDLVRGICGLVKLCEKKEHGKRGEELTENFYPSVVTKEGNVQAQKKTEHFFEYGDTVWRGIGNIPGSGLFLREEFLCYDAGSYGISEDKKMNPRCCCDKVLTGKLSPAQCPLFGKECTPFTPQGACMVSSEGSCAAAATGL